MTREATCKILEMADDHRDCPDLLIHYIECALNYMSEDDVKRMAEINELFYDEETRE